MDRSTAFFGHGLRLRAGKSGKSRTISHPVATPAASAAPAAVTTGMTYTRTDLANACVLQIAGALDIHSALEIRFVFESVLASKFPVVTLDLTGLVALDSSGVGAIVHLFKLLGASGGRLVVEGVQGQPLAVCKLLKLDRVFGFER